MASNINFHKPIYCIITGASRGLGRTIAVEVARKSLDKLTLLLLARSETGLAETKDYVKQVKSDTEIITVAVDLSKPNVEEYEDIIKNSLKNIDDLGSAFIFHNAGQIGCLKTVINLPEVSLWQNYFTMNLFSVTSLNSVFINQINNLTKNIVVVNITSLFGRKAGKYVGMYGSAKAARDLYFKVLAEEESYVKVLNWSPGMVKTDMAVDLLEQMDIIEGTNHKEETIKNVLTSEQTVGKMFKVLEQNDYESGDIVDYYDKE